MNYFWNKVNGLKADIERHTKEQQKLEKKILEIEQILEKNPSDEFAKRSLKSYMHFLNLLLDSKAQLTSKIGKNKA